MKKLYIYLFGIIGLILGIILFIPIMCFGCIKTRLFSIFLVIIGLSLLGFFILFHEPKRNNNNQNSN